MEWIDKAKELWWLFGVLLLILGALWRLAIKTNKSKERLERVEVNKKAIEALQNEMTGIKDDISEIKVGVDKQGEDTAAILSSLQSIMNILFDRDCNIGPAREKFSDYLAKR